MSRKVIVEQLKDYFATKGGAMTAEQYREAEDAPIRIQVLKRKLGSWSRIMNMVGMKAPVIAVVVPEPVVEPAVELVVEPAVELVVEPVVEIEPAPTKAASKTKGA